MAERLRALGHEVVAAPVRRLEPLVDQPAVKVVLDSLWAYDWVVFVSPGAVEAVWPSLALGWPPGTGVAVIGPGTESALLAQGFQSLASAGLVRPRQAPFDAAALLREAPFDTPRGLKVLVIRGQSGRDDWIDRLRGAGAQVEVLPAYRSVPLALDEALLHSLGGWLRQARAQPLAFVFTSADAIDALSAAIEPMDRVAAVALTVHPRLAEALHKCGWLNVIEIEPGESGLLRGIESLTRS